MKIKINFKKSKSEKSGNVRELEKRIQQYSEQIREFEEEKRMAETKLKEIISLLMSRLEDIKIEHDTVLKSLDKKEKDLIRLETEKRAYETEIERLKRSGSGYNRDEIDLLRSNIRKIEMERDTVLNTLENQKAELQDCLTKNDKFTQQLALLQDNIAHSEQDLQMTRELLDENQQLFQEQLNSAQAEIQRLERDSGQIPEEFQIRLKTAQEQVEELRRQLRQQEEAMRRQQEAVAEQGVVIPTSPVVIPTPQVVTPEPPVVVPAPPVVTPEPEALNQEEARRQQNRKCNKYVMRWIDRLGHKYPTREQYKDFIRSNSSSISKAEIDQCLRTYDIKLHEEIGTTLYPQIEQILRVTGNDDKTSKITGMILELKIINIKELLDSEDNLREKVAEALQVLQEVKQKTGETLYPQIEQILRVTGNDDKTSKITSMILELDIPDIRELLNSEDNLREKVVEALQVLQEFEAETPPPVPPMPNPLVPPVPPMPNPPMPNPSDETWMSDDDEDDYIQTVQKEEVKKWVLRELGRFPSLEEMKQKYPNIANHELVLYNLETDTKFLNSIISEWVKKLGHDPSAIEIQQFRDQNKNATFIKKLEERFHKTIVPITYKVDKPILQMPVSINVKRGNYVVIGKNVSKKDGTKIPSVTTELDDGHYIVDQDGNTKRMGILKLSISENVTRGNYVVIEKKVYKKNGKITPIITDLDDGHYFVDKDGKTEEMAFLAMPTSKKIRPGTYTVEEKGEEKGIVKNLRDTVVTSIGTVLGIGKYTVSENMNTIPTPSR